MNSTAALTVKRSSPQQKSKTGSTRRDQKGGEIYRPMLLGHYVEEGFAIMGLAVMLLDPNNPFEFPSGAIPIISKVLLDAGDAK